MILKNKLFGSAARLGRGFQTRPGNSSISTSCEKKLVVFLFTILFLGVFLVPNQRQWTNGKL